MKLKSLELLAREGFIKRSFETYEKEKNGRVILYQAVTNKLAMRYAGIIQNGQLIYFTTESFYD